MSVTAASKSQEWRAHWPLVLTALVGFSFPTITSFSIGLFMEPLHQEFGWGRTEVSAGVTLAALLMVPSSPFVGALIDRWGVRRLALPGILLTALAIAAFSLANGSVKQWLMLWALYGLASLLVKATIWISAVSSKFTAGRSLALGVTLTGSALAAGLTPPLTRWLIDTFGWRDAYMLLGLGWGLPTLVLCLFFLFDARDTNRRATADAASEPPAPLAGLSMREAVRSLPLLRIGLATLIAFMISNSLVIHKVPILTEAGVTRETAALLASLSGAAALLGKLVTGWLMERFDAGWVGGLTNAVTAAAMLLLLEPFRTPALIVASMVVVGYAGGTKLQICAYLTSIYGGARNFGKIFGVMTSIIAAAGGLGPLLGGVIYDLSGGYDLLILIGAPATLFAGLLLIRLGPFPEWSAAAAHPRRVAAPKLATTPQGVRET